MTHPKVRVFFAFAAMLLMYALYLWTIGGFIESGGDATYYWYFSKQLLCSELKDLYWTHHKNIRFGVLIPTVFFQWLLGEEPQIYFVVPLFFSLIVFGLVWKISKDLLGALPAIIAVLLFWSFDDLHRETTQLLPTIFASAYFLAFLGFVLLAIKASQKTALWVFLAGLAGYAAYTVKIPELFFVFSALVPLIMNKKHRLLGATIVGFLIALLLLETSIFNHFLGTKLGSIDVANLSHNVYLRTKALPFLQLIARFQTLPITIRLLAISSLVALMVSFKKKRLDIQIISFGVIGYIVLNLIAVKSVFPFHPAIRIIPRYFSAIIPLQGILLVWLLCEIVPKIRNASFPFQNKRLIQLSYFGIIVFLVYSILDFKKGDSHKSQRIEAALTDFETIAKENSEIGLGSTNHVKEITRLIIPVCPTRPGPRILENEDRLNSIFEYFLRAKKDNIKVLEGDFASTSYLYNSPDGLLKKYFGKKNKSSLKCVEGEGCTGKILLNEIKFKKEEMSPEIRVFDRKTFQVSRKNFIPWLQFQYIDQYDLWLARNRKYKDQNLLEIPKDFHKEFLDK